MTLFLQLLLAVVITSLTILVSVLGFQIFQLLHEFKLSLKKLNAILSHTESLSDSAARPVAAVNNFFAEVKDLVRDTQDEIIDSTPDKVITSVAKSDKFPKRFFRRSGLPLRPS